MHIRMYVIAVHPHGALASRMSSAIQEFQHVCICACKYACMFQHVCICACKYACMFQQSVYVHTSMHLHNHSTVQAPSAVTCSALHAFETVLSACICYRNVCARMYLYADLRKYFDFESGYLVG
jgi:hypothetical protein